MTDDIDIYKFINEELKTVHNSIGKCFNEVSQINERIAVLETRIENNSIDTNSIERLNLKLDVLNSKLIGDINIKKTSKQNWVQVGKVIGLIISGVAAILGGYFAGTAPADKPVKPPIVSVD